MLKFLNIFKKEKEKVTLNSDQLESWLAVKIEERVLDMDGAVQALYKTVEQLRDTLRKQCGQLNDAFIKDEDKIEARVRSIVLGHRTNYCRELSIFLNNIEIPMETHLDHGIRLNSDVTLALDVFARQTHKSFQATQHLFHREVEAIAATLQELSEITRAFDELLEKKCIRTLDIIKKQVELFKKETTKKRRLQQELHLRKSRVESALKSKDTKMHEISALQESPDFKEYETLLEKRAQLADAIAAIERDISELFLGLERALRKYEYLAAGEEQAFIQRYIKDPKEALKNDQSLAIWAVFGQLQQKIVFLELKEDQHQKTMEILGQQSREKLSDLRNKYVALLQELDLARKRIQHHPVLVHLQEKEYKLRHFEEQAVRFEKEIEHFNEELKIIRVEDIALKLKEDISRVLGVELTVVFGD